MRGIPSVQTITIANDASLSGEIPLHGLLLVGIGMPSSWTAANLTFQVANRETALGGTYRDLYDASGTEVTATAAASRHIVIARDAFQGAAYLKVRSGTSSAAVNQGADRSLTLYLVKEG